MKFTREQNKVLSEIYRRLNFFHGGDLDTNLLYLGFPSDAKKIAEFGLIMPTRTESPRVLSWYNLTEKGKKFFSHYQRKNKLSESVNSDLFDGTYVKTFDPSFL